MCVWLVIMNVRSQCLLYVSYGIVPYICTLSLSVCLASFPALPVQMSIGALNVPDELSRVKGVFYIRFSLLEAICELFYCVSGLGILILADSIDEAICPSTKSATIKSCWLFKCRNLHILRDNYEIMQRDCSKKKRSAGKCMPSTFG